MSYMRISTSNTICGETERERQRKHIGQIMPSLHVGLQLQHCSIITSTMDSMGINYCRPSCYTVCRKSFSFVMSEKPTNAFWELGKLLCSHRKYHWDFPSMKQLYFCSWQPIHGRNMGSLACRNRWRITTLDFTLRRWQWQ